MSEPLVHVCFMRAEPGERECWTAIWSQGRDCKTCWIKCYRAGWEKARVDADNRRLVRLENSHD